MRVAELLSQLRNRDVHVVLDGERLRVNAPAGALTDECRRELRERKPEIVTFLRTARQLAERCRAIVPLKSTGTRTPIFAMGGHNGDVFCYVALVRHLDVDQPFYGLQPPGLEEGSEPLGTVEELARYFADQIREFQPEGPLAVGGFCAGGTIAFELARQLSDSGRKVSQVMMFGAPYCGSYRLLPDFAARCSNFTRSAFNHTRTLIGMSPLCWHRYLSERLDSRRSTGDDTRDDAPATRRVAVEKTTLAAVRRYRARPFDGEVTVMLPSKSAKRSLDAPLRWCRYASASTAFVGPEGCNGDTMLLSQYAPTFAAFVDSASRHAARAG